jgi:hypothetical protein
MNLRAALALAFALVVATETFAATTTNDLVKAAAAGRELAQQLRSLRPETPFTNIGKLFIRVSRKQKWETSYTCRVTVTATNWTSHYTARRGTNDLPGFSVEHRDGQPNIYRDDAGRVLSGSQLDVAFAGSDFWKSDLGLEFFHWPEQRVLKWEMKRSFGCRVLESKNPSPTPGSYSRVLSWIHEETGALIQAEAYDARGKLLKEFRPTETEKVNGRHELKEMEIENAQTGSSTRLEFDL